MYKRQAPNGSAITEDFNGATWQEVADLSGGRRNAGASGTSTSGLAFAGSNPTIIATTEEWSGSTNLTKTIDTD